MACDCRLQLQLNTSARYIRLQLDRAPRHQQGGFGATSRTRRPGDVNLSSVRLGDGTISYSRAGSRATVHVSQPVLPVARPRGSTRRRRGKRKGSAKQAQRGGEVTTSGAAELEWWVEGVLAREGEVVTRDGDLAVLALSQVRVHHKGMRLPPDERALR